MIYSRGWCRRVLRKLGGGGGEDFGRIFERLSICATTTIKVEGFLVLL